MKIQNIALAAVCAAAPLAAVACKGDSHVVIVNTRSANAKFVARDSSRALSEGDVRVFSTDSAVELAVIGDSIIGGLGPMARKKVADATDTANVKGTGFAAGIEKMVKSKVAGALAHELEFPISEISDVKYEAGTLRFYGTDGKQMHFFENSKNGKQETSTQFSAADAQTFISAFKSRKRV